MNAKQMVKELQDKQRKLQKWYAQNIKELKPKGYEYRMLWIKVQCRCEHDFRTPFFIPDNGKCHKCNKSFIRVKK